MSAPGRAGQAYYGNWCNVSGCKRPRMENVVHGRCRYHHHIFLANGDPLQKTIRHTALKACEKITKGWIARAKREPSWDASLMDPLRRNLESAAKDVAFDLKEYLNGKALRNGIRDALKILDSWHNENTPEERFNFWLGIQYFYMHYPKSFASFNGYKAQVVRLMYRKTSVKIGRPITLPNGKLLYKRLKVPRYMYEFVWEHLFGIFGGVAQHMNRVYNTEHLKEQSKHQIFDFFNGGAKQLATVEQFDREIERIRKALYRVKLKRKELLKEEKLKKVPEDLIPL